MEKMFRSDKLSRHEQPTYPEPYNQCTEGTDRRPQIIEQLSGLGCCLNALEDSVEELRERLHIITMPEYPTEGPVDALAKQPTSQFVPLAEDLSILKNRADRLHSQVRSLIERIEL